MDCQHAVLNLEEGQLYGARIVYKCFFGLVQTLSHAGLIARILLLLFVISSMELLLMRLFGIIEQIPRPRVYS